MAEPVEVIEARDIPTHLRAAALSLPPALSLIVQQQSRALAEDIRQAYEARMDEMSADLECTAAMAVQGMAAQLLVLWDACQRVAAVAALNLGVSPDDFGATAIRDFEGARAALAQDAATQSTGMV